LAESPRPRLRLIQVQSIHRPAPKIRQSQSAKDSLRPSYPVRQVLSKFALLSVANGSSHGSSTRPVSETRS
jgi:hypothetical protein